MLPGHTPFHACVYCPAVSSTINFLDEFLSLLSFFHLLTVYIISVVYATFTLMYHVVVQSSIDFSCAAAKCCVQVSLYLI